METMKVVVLEGGSLQSFKDNTAKDLFKMTKQEAHIQGVCIDCKVKVRRVPTDDGPGAIYSPEGCSEYNITGICEHCFDAMFAEPEEPNEE